VERIDLPPTPVLTLSSNWGVIRSPFLRLRDEPLQKAKITAHLRRGSVLEIISRTEAKETIGEETAYWYQVNYGGLRGWVFGAFLEVLDSKSEAERIDEVGKKTGVFGQASDLPSALVAAPNPFRTLAHLSAASVLPGTLVGIFDPLGRQVRILELHSPAAGPCTATWDGRDNRGRRVDAGIYIARLPAGASTRLVLLD